MSFICELSNDFDINLYLKLIFTTRRHLRLSHRRFCSDTTIQLSLYMICYHFSELISSDFAKFSIICYNLRVFKEIKIKFKSYNQIIVLLNTSQTFL